MKSSHYTKKLPTLVKAAIFSGALFGVVHFAAAGTAAGDDVFLNAREAFASGNRQRLARALESLRGHELEPWAEYYLLRQQMEESSAGIPEFLIRYQNSLPAERLRSDWVKLQGRRGQWSDVLREYPQLQQPDQEAQCYALQARLASGDAGALDEARPLWFSANELPDACMSLMDALVSGQRLQSEDVWQRVRRLLEAKKLRAARIAANYLPDAQIPDARTLDAISDNPMRYLAKLSAAQIDAAKNSRRIREQILYAINRVAANDPDMAAREWQKVENAFPPADRGYAWGQLAMQAARRHAPDALDWYARADNTPLNDEQLAWQVRAALRAGDWAAVRRTILRMQPTQATQPDWIYWHGRALAAQGKAMEAKLLYQQIAGQPSFYGNLASDELGQPIKPPPPAIGVSPAELAEAENNPGLRRALALLRVDARIDAVKEWNWSLRGMSDRQLLAAAELARRNGIFDRAISAADRTVVQHDYSLRYLAPYRDQVEPKARELALDTSWVYGLMRQESRFVIRAKSAVGAQGLMQVMPNTAKWVAKKIGLTSFRPHAAEDMDTNVTIGTNYMKMVLDSLDDHPVLASAAYNAGPSRARNWRADKPLEGAIYAETIPFTETRDYVKKVMCNTVYYAALFENKPQSLKARLGVVRSRGNGDIAADELP